MPKYVGKLQKISVEVPTATARQIEDMAAERMQQHYRKHPADKTMTQAQWAIMTKEGREFMRDCVTHKYARLSHAELRKVARQAYLDTVDAQPQKGPTLKDFKAEILAEAIELLSKNNTKYYRN
jgi:hypothetical protein